MSLNEPSMEDILASIRRIIAEDQSNSLGRSGLGGLTRRSQPAAPALATDESIPSAGLEEAPLAQISEEPDLHAGAQADMLQHAYEAMPVESQAVTAEHVEPSAPELQTEAAASVPYEAHDLDEQLARPETHLAAQVAEDDGQPLMSAATGASITSSFQTLAESVVLQDPDLIERVMRDAMRPLLKAWLDDHLPSIVERLVRTEIERVARGGRARNA